MDIKYRFADIETSKKIYGKCKKFIKLNQCFTNVALTFLNYIKYEEGFKDYKIVFGAWEIKVSNKESNIFAKHCYFVKDDKVIDPTIFVTSTEYITRRYINIFEFNQDEYYNQLEDNNFDTGLGFDMTKKLNIEAMNLYKDNIIIIG